MFKRFPWRLNGKRNHVNGSPTAGGGKAHEFSVLFADDGRSPAPLLAETPASAKIAGFDEIYESAGAKLPRVPYGILKVREMADSPHLTGMSPDAKRGALLMALEAAGVETEDLLQDAVARQRVLTDYEEKQEERLRECEAAKTEMNRAIQAELDRITAQYMARIQGNLDEIARQQDSFHAWKKRKQQECQRIAEAAALLVSQANGSYHGTLTAVLERASVSRH